MAVVAAAVARRARRPRGVRARRHPAGILAPLLPGHQGAGRVPAADPVGRADPAGHPAVRPGAAAQDVADRLRLHLAGAVQHRLRRPGRGPDRQGHRPLLRLRTARDPRPGDAAGGLAVHRHRRARGLGDRADPGHLHRAAGRRRRRHRQLRPARQLRRRQRRPGLRGHGHDRGARPGAQLGAAAGGAQGARLAAGIGDGPVSGQAVQGDARGQAPGRRPAPGPGRRARWRPADPVGLALRWLVLLVVAVAWQLATMGGRSVFFPPLTEVLRQARSAWLSGPASHAFLTPAVASDVVPSLGRLLGGWLLAVVAGVSVGTAVGLVRNLADYLDPVIEFVRAIPPPAMIPPFLVVLGLGSDMKVALIAVGVVWPILLNTIDGVRSVDPVLVDTGRAFRTRRVRRLAFIVLPSASPRIFAGLRVSLSLALILMVISEMVAATGGIGFTIVQAERSFAITQMWAGILLLGVLGYLLNSLLLLVERRVLAWHRGARGTQESA